MGDKTRCLSTVVYIALVISIQYPVSIEGIFFLCDELNNVRESC